VAGFRESSFPTITPAQHRFYSPVVMGGGECKPSEEARSLQPGAWKACPLALALLRKIGYVRNVA
jgi:hypothetical protein